MKVLSYTQSTLGTAAKQLKIFAPAGARHVDVQAEAQNLRWRADETNPTTTVGELIIVNEKIRLDGDLDQIVIIGVAGGAIANITFYGDGANV